MKKYLAAVLAAVICLLCGAGCSDTGERLPAEVPPTSVTQTQTTGMSLSDEPEPSAAPESSQVCEYTPLDEAVKEKADAICRSYGAVGVQAAVIKDGAVCAGYEYGSADIDEDKAVMRDTKFRVASLSKLVTDTVFMRLTQIGPVSENEDIGKYLGYEVRNPLYPDEPITARMLMTHTSSIVDSADFLSSRQNASAVPTEELLRRAGSYSASEPGTSYCYSNFGVAVLGAVCERVTGRCFDDLANEYIFAPLGIDASYVASGIRQRELIGCLYGQGGYTVQRQLADAFCEEPGRTHHLVQGNLTISAYDYARIICMLLNGGAADTGERILDRDTAAKILTVYAKDGDFGIGYGVQREDGVLGEDAAWVHTGSNFGMYAAFAFTSDGSGAVVLTSGADGGKDGKTDIYNVCLDLARLFYQDHIHGDRNGAETGGN